MTSKSLFKSSASKDDHKKYYDEDLDSHRVSQDIDDIFDQEEDYDAIKNRKQTEKNGGNSGKNSVTAKADGYKPAFKKQPIQGSSLFAPKGKMSVDKSKMQDEDEERVANKENEHDNSQPKKDKKAKSKSRKSDDEEEDDESKKESGKGKKKETPKDGDKKKEKKEKEETGKKGKRDDSAKNKKDKSSDDEGAAKAKTKKNEKESAKENKKEEKKGKVAKNESDEETEKTEKKPKKVMKNAKSDSEDDAPRNTKKKDEKKDEKEKGKSSADKGKMNIEKSGKSKERSVDEKPKVMKKKEDAMDEEKEVPKKKLITLPKIEKKERVEKSADKKDDKNKKSSLKKTSDKKDSGKKKKDSGSKKKRVKKVKKSGSDDEGEADFEESESNDSYEGDDDTEEDETESDDEDIIQLPTDLYGEFKKPNEKKPKKKTNVPYSLRSAEEGSESKRRKADTLLTPYELGLDGPRAKKCMMYSGLLEDDQDVLHAAVIKMQGFGIEALRGPFMTHLVIDGDKRTVKVLYALAKRAWILDKSFLYASLEFGDWVAEKEHESKLYPEKKLRDACGPLFKDMRFYLNSTQYPTMTAEELQTLIKLTGAKVCDHAKDADVIIENGLDKSDILNSKDLEGHHAVLITYKWILDSLTKYQKLSYNGYTI